MTRKIKSETYCPIPFHHTIVRTNNHCGVCCAFQDKDHEEKTGVDTNIHVNDLSDLSEYLNSDAIVEIQQKMLNGEKVAGCKVCYERESFGYESVRTKELKRVIDNDRSDVIYEKAISGEKLDLTYLEITFGNFCNLACRSCASELSTSWYEDDAWMHNNTEYGKYFIKKWQGYGKLNVTRDFNVKDLKDLKLIKITGGEPMLHPNFYKFLGAMPQNNIACEIFTNTSHVPKKRLLKSLLKFKKIKLFLSIDDIGTGQEYMRHNSNWDTTVKSAIEWLKWTKENTDKVQLILAPTFSIYNAESVPRLLDWWLNITNNYLEEDADRVIGGVHSNILSRPEWMQLFLHKRKEEILKQSYHYLKYLKKSDLYGASKMTNVVSGFINYLDAPVSENKLKTLRKEFVEITTHLDRRRNQSLEKVYPKLYEDFKEEFEEFAKRD